MHACNYMHTLIDDNGQRLIVNLWCFRMEQYTVSVCQLIDSTRRFRGYRFRIEDSVYDIISSQECSGVLIRMAVIIARAHGMTAARVTLDDNQLIQYVAMLMDNEIALGIAMSQPEFYHCNEE